MRARSSTTAVRGKPGTPKATRAERRPKGDAADTNRGAILEAAEGLFSTKGFHGTTLRDIAHAAEVSLGNVYNHFAGKEALFAELMKELERRYLSADVPLARALTELDFPDGIEKLGHAARDTVKRFASYIRLIYVDVTELEGKHVARLYGGMRQRYEAVLGERMGELKRTGKVGSSADPMIATMMASTIYMYYFTIEHLFGVRRHYGLDDDEVIREFAKVFRFGVLKR